MSGPPSWDAVEVGTQLPPFTDHIARVDLIRYAGASGDFNVIHWNQRVAQEVGLPDVIAHGMRTMAGSARILTDWVGDPGAVLEYGVRFTRPVVVPDDDHGAIVDVSAVVAAKLEGRRVRIDVTATVAGQKVLSMSRAVVQLS